jgi:hypothetical protein
MIHCYHQSTVNAMRRIPDFRSGLTIAWMAVPPDFDLRQRPVQPAHDSGSAFRCMARIRSGYRGNLMRVSIAGRLTMADMGRLEHACAPALTRQPANLEIDLRRVTFADDTARAVIHRFAQRGAQLIELSHPDSEGE